MFAGGLSSMVGDGIKDDDTDANAGMILNFLGNQVSFLYLKVFAEFVQGNIQIWRQATVILKFSDTPIYIVLFYIFLAKTLRFFHLHGRGYEPLLVWSIRTENLSTSGKKLSYLMAKNNHYTLYFLFFLCVDHVIFEV